VEGVFAFAIDFESEVGFVGFAGFAGIDVDKSGLIESPRFYSGRLRRNYWN